MSNDLKSATPESNVRTTHTIAKKIEAIMLFDKIGKKCEVAKELGIDPSLISKWISQRDRLLELADTCQQTNKKRIIHGGRKAFYPELERALYECLKRENKPNDYKSVKRKAHTLFNQIYPDQEGFKASNRWVINFARRYKISYRKPNHDNQNMNKSESEEENEDEDDEMNFVNFPIEIQQNDRNYVTNETSFDKPLEMESGKRKPGRKNNVKLNPRQAANYNEYSDENFEDFEETPEKIPRFDETDHIDNTHHLDNIKTENADFEFDESQDLGDTHDESNSYQLPNDPSTDLQNNFLRLFDFKVPESNDGNVNVECFKNFVDIVKNSFNSFYIEYQRQQIEIDQLKRHLFINQKPNEPKTFIYNGQDLMTIFAKDPKKYALCIAKIIFTEEELEKCLVTNVPDKSLPQTSRVPLPGNKMKIFTEAIMKRFDLNDSSFGEWWPKIKESINACGRHKKAKKKKQTVDINESQNITNMFDQNINNF